MGDPAFVGVSEAARRLGVSVSQVRNLWAQGRLEGEWSVYGRLVSVASLEAEIDRRARLALEDT